MLMQGLCGIAPIQAEGAEHLSFSESLLLLQLLKREENPWGSKHAALTRLTQAAGEDLFEATCSQWQLTTKEVSDFRKVASSTFVFVI